MICSLFDNLFFFVLGFFFVFSIHAMLCLQWHHHQALQVIHQLLTTKVILNLLVTPLILVGSGILIKTRTREQNWRNNKS